MKRNRFVRSFLFAGMLLMGMSNVSNALPTFTNTAPVFVATNTLVPICMNSTAVDITSYLTVNDPDEGQTLTWSVALGGSPSNGSLSFIPTSSSTGGGGNVTPTGISYTPNVGYSGPDQFTIMVDDGSGGTATITISVGVNNPPSLTLGANPAVCQGTTSASISFTGLTNVGPATSYVGFTGGPQVWMVPPGVTSINFDMMGAVGGRDNHSGAADPGLGGRLQGALSVFPDEVLNLFVGGSGQPLSGSMAPGGYNGGGNAYNYSTVGCGGSGGGATDIRIGGVGLGDRVAVAGGGGGNGWDAPGPYFGGGGGNTTGGSSQDNQGHTHAFGGSQSGGGAPATYAGWLPGIAGIFGTGGDGSSQGISGGGGGGYYGGGGGIWTGGGGGSSFPAAPTAYVSGMVHTQGCNDGDGQIIFNYVIPGTYTIMWDTIAHAAGFTDVVNATLPTSSFNITVPGAATPSVYNGILTIANVQCTSVQYAIQVTVNPIPTVSVPDGQVRCNGFATDPVIFSGSVEGTTFTWTNDNNMIGLPSFGSGNIGSFTATNGATTPIVGNITVTPHANGCDGTPVTFSYTVNPTPTLNTGLTPPAICNITPFSYTPGSDALGTTFIWSRAAVPGISNIDGSGSDNPDELLVNTTPLPITVTYVFHMASNGCVNDQNVNVVVYPTPLLSTSVTPPAVCSGHVFNYPASSATPGTTYSWNRSFVTGISNAPNSGVTNNPMETLNNTTSDPVVVTYVYTLEANGCFNSQNVTVTINPTPMLSSSLTPPAICDSTLFNYTPTSATDGSVFNWNRNAVPGIANFATVGTGNPMEYLVNTTANQITVPYIYTTYANGCSNVQTVNIVVNPKPMLTNTLTPTVCDGLVFNYPAASATPSTTFIWDRNAVVGISNIAASGFDNPNEILHNTTPNAVIDTYMYTLMANGCSNTQYVRLTVYPTPKLSSTLTPHEICDSDKFIYAPTSLTAGTTFNWYRPYIPGIYAVAETGMNNPNQQLINSTYVPIDVTYIYALAANGCVDTQDVVVTVNPTPKLTGPFSGTVCSGSPFSYAPNSLTPNATFAWNRPEIAGITPPTSYGTGGIHEAVVNDGLVPITVQYIYRLGIGTCINLYTQTVNVKVNPTPPVPAITTAPGSTLCAGTMNQNFGTATAPPATVQYTWTATNAQVWATGNNGQYCVVNFPTPGQAVITLNANVMGYDCIDQTSYTVNVSNSQSENVQVIYFNGQFVCLKNDNGSYQWGYDDASTLVPTTLSGEINQNYDNKNPDFNTKRYWVITDKDGCAQKSYYNPPTGVANVNEDATEVKVYPNPAMNSVNVEINTTVGGDVEVNLLNMLGQQVATRTINDHKTTFDVTALPAGCYFVDCYRNGVKIANARFIKN